MAEFESVPSECVSQASGLYLLMVWEAAVGDPV